MDPVEENHLLDYIGIQLWFLVDEKTYSGANKAHADFLGFEDRDLKNRDFLDIFDENEAEINITNNKRAFACKEKTLAKEWVKNSDGVKRLLSITRTPKLDKKGDVEYIICSAEDITDFTSSEKTNEELLSEITDRLPDNLAVIDTDGTIIHVNDGWREFARNNDLDPERCSEGTNYLKVCNEATGDKSEEAPVAAKGIRDVIQGYKDTFELEYPCHAPDKERWFIMKVIPLNKKPRPCPVLMYHLDITKRKETEYELKRSEENYKELIDGMSDTVWVMDLDGNFIDVNKAAVNVLGYTREELLSMKPQDIDSSLNPEYIQNLFKQIPADKVQVFETTHVTKDEKPIPVEINSSIVNYNGKTAILSVARNITKRKQLEERLNKVNSTLVNLGPDHDENIQRLTSLCGELFDADAALYNRLVNGMMYTQAHWNAPADYNPVAYPEGHICYEVIMDGSKKIWSFKDLNNTPYAATDPNVTAYGLKSYIGRVVHCNEEPVGALCVVFQHGVEFTDDDEHIISIIASSISSEEERKKAAEYLQEYARKLETLNETREMFTDILRHDLLNPIGLVKGFADLLYKKEKDTAKLNLIEKIIRNNSRAIELIEKAGELAKIECMDNIEFQPMDVSNILQKTITELQSNSVDKNINIKFVNGSNKHYYANVNPIVQQAFSNLISNSIKYSPEGSEVIVDILDKGDYWKIRVKDSGPGISDEDKSQLFDRFKRGKAKTTAGKGLGLSIVKSIIDLHGGSVDVEDNPDGEGSMFWISVEKSR